MDYITTFVLSFIFSFILTPIFRIIAKKFSILDYPHSNIKTHTTPVPYLGGLSIAFSFYITLFFVRATTNFPTGTLHSLRGIILGSILILILGFIDDIKYKGIHYTTKFVGEFFAAVMLIMYGIKIKFISPEWISLIITILWIIGITNAINLIDVMDGLSAGVSFIACLGLFFITHFVEEEIYVGYATLALSGACLGFLPYNLSKKYKIFMGDTGALFIGFILSAVTLGGKYSLNNPLGVLSPIIILLIPIYETLLLSYLRLNRGQSPFVGSKDHFSLRLLSVGIKKYEVLLLTYTAGLIFSIIGIIIVLSKVIYIPILLFIILFVLIIIITRYLIKINVNI